MVEHNPQGGLKTKSEIIWKKIRATEVPESQSKRREVTKAAIYDIVSVKVRLEERVTIPVMSQVKDPVESKISILGTLENKQGDRMNYRLRVANGSSRASKTSYYIYLSEKSLTSHFTS